MEYFSDKESTPEPRVIEEIPVNVWNGIVSLIQSGINTGSFGLDFPELCPDGNAVIGVDRTSFLGALQAELPEVEFPLETSFASDDSPPYDTLTILDLIQFTYEHIAEPRQVHYHTYFNHYHLSFDRAEGRMKFLDDVNRIFSRNGIAYELNEYGNILRLISEVDKTLIDQTFDTGDTTLDNLLSEAQCKFLNPEPEIRKEALDKLWDAWERVKTIKNPRNKRESIRLLLEEISDEPNFRGRLNNEAIELTDIGNKFHIRHHETNQTELEDPTYVDYLFVRMFAMINLIIKHLND
jgi:hypothetical protein